VKILVLNSGSSSIKYRLFRMESMAVLRAGARVSLMSRRKTNRCSRGTWPSMADGSCGGRRGGDIDVGQTDHTTAGKREIPSL
jgi:hypothetical protein